MSRWMVLAWSVLSSEGATPSYNQDIRPLLSDNCFFCHGPDQNQRKGKLRLDVREDAVAKKAIVPGQPDQSELIRRILATDPDDVMPPPDSHKQLTDAQKDLLRRWIAAGAEYQGHWAYVRPVRPTLPAEGHPIDVLVRARLQELGVRPSPAADRRTLARRLHFDLVGLPPQPAAVEALVRDAAPEAYGRYVDGLLASKHYGERMAVPWLDVVRFADTIGYHSDNPRSVWPYRDYVIASFNANKPFDRFTREQLAGDLLPQATVEQKVGSAFNRLLLSTEEGGAQPKDYEARMLTDRVRAVSTVWLGQTIGCAQCHDHKFDPITMRDFYSMGAFFADVKETIIGRREDGMLVPDSAQASELARLGEQVRRHTAEFEQPREEGLARWEKAVSAVADLEAAWSALEPVTLQAESQVALKAEEERVIRAEKDPPGGKDVYRVTLRSDLKVISAFRLEAVPGDKMPKNGPGRGADGAWVLTEIDVEDAQGRRLAWGTASTTGEDAALPAAAAVDGSVEAAQGWGQARPNGSRQVLHLPLREAWHGDAGSTFTFVLRQQAGAKKVLGRFRLAATAESRAHTAPALALPPAEIMEVVRVPLAQRSDPQKSKLTGHYRDVAPELAELRQRLAAVRKVQADYEASVAKCLVTIPTEERRVVRILPRGNWMIETGETVAPALPAYLAPAKAETSNRPLTRLDLADWLVSREHPLTARVFVNRLWKQFFGSGLSKVLDDFGSQGEPPGHAALLDWLACEFMDSGWDIKHLVRLIVTSETYQQTSVASQELLARDPENRLLARQSRWRAEAEFVRDYALSFAGLLVPRIGGPSVKPYQPEGYWENLNFPQRTYEASTGADQYRRGLYTWWQRSFLHPSMVAFDAPSREECAAERNRSNIPQQALVLLNDPTYVEAARGLARRIVRECDGDVGARINWAWRQVLARTPRPEELEATRALWEKHWAQYQQDRSAAEALTQVGASGVPADLDRAELAAWTSIARILLNLHETITRS